MFYYLYEIKNLINNKIYVGVHKIQDMNDGYMGSGKVIRSAIEKYGIENFQKVILETFNDEKDMYAREKEIVTEDFLSRKDVYNLRRGGTGGFDYINRNKLNYGGKEGNSRGGKKGGVISGNLAKLNKTGYHQSKYHRFKNSEIQKKGCLAAQTEEAKIKRKQTFKKIGHAQGEKNSQFGTVWITDGIHNQKVKKNSVVPIGWKQGRVLKKQNEI